MATKNFETEIEEGTIEETQEQPKSKRKGAMTDYESIKIMPTENDRAVLKSGQPLPDEHVCINGKTWSIKKGVTVDVPKLVAEVLRESGII